MNPIEQLFSKRMIIRRVDPTTFYQVKDALKSIRKIMQEKFGYIVIFTPQLIKLEKIPAIPEIWMGIQSFQSVREYQIFLYVLMFLEDKEIEEQFVLSHLTDFIYHQFENGGIDWTNYTTRRQLIRVIQYCLKNHLMILNDGDASNFARDISVEVLYENTGLSRYFMRNFPKDIMGYQDHEDFKESDWIDIDEDRGIARRHRVYRKLLLSMGVYEADQNEDFLYLKNYRNQIQLDFQTYFECDLHVHKSSAYLVLDEFCRMGKTFPENNVFSDLALLTNQKLMENASKKHYGIEHDENINLEKHELEQIITKIVKKHINLLPKAIQQLDTETITKNTIDYMESIGFLAQNDNMIKIYPIIAKVAGGYVKEVKS